MANQSAERSLLQIQWMQEKRVLTLEKVPVLGLDYGHIDVLDKERSALRLSKSALAAKKTNKSDAYWLSCCIAGDQNRYVVGYGGVDNVFVVECIN